MKCQGEYKLEKTCRYIIVLKNYRALRLHCTASIACMYVCLQCMEVHKYSYTTTFKALSISIVRSKSIETHQSSDFNPATVLILLTNSDFSTHPEHTSPMSVRIFLRSRTFSLLRSTVLKSISLSE